MNEHRKGPMFGGAANQISIGRLILLPPIFWPLENLTVAVHLALLGLFFTLDMVDGFVARRWGLASAVGGSIDLLVDRLMEMTLWMYFVLLGYIPPHIVFILVGRFCFVDGANLYLALARSSGSIQVWLTSWKKILITAKWCKGAYCALKCCIFAVLLVRADTATSVLPLPIMFSLLLGLVLISLLRGLPVLVQALHVVLASGIDRPLQVREGPENSRLLVLQLSVDVFFFGLLMLHLLLSPLLFN